MAEITDPVAIAFVNNYVRPMAEALRDLSPRLIDMRSRWFAGGMSLACGTDGDTIEDGREDQGVSRLISQDVIEVMTEVGIIADSFALAGVLDNLSVPCVRPLATGG